MSATACIHRDSVRLTFSAPWDASGHELFIKAKRLPEARYEFDRTLDSYVVTAPARFAPLVGLTPPAQLNDGEPLAAHLFPVQKWIVQMALDAKRFAIWADCGFGKTPMGLEWARQVREMTRGRILIIVPNRLVKNWQQEAVKFYGADAAPFYLETSEQVAKWCRGEFADAFPIAICNFHKFIESPIADVRYCAGIVLDESSILKGGGGVIKWNLIKSCRGIEYKLSLTATPAPNDTMEYASQASFLEKLRNEGEILWTYFTRDPRTQEWKVRPHARKAFYRFMSSWSIYIRKASAYGFKDAFTVEEPRIIEHHIKMTDEQKQEFERVVKTDELLALKKLGLTERNRLSQIAKGFVYDDPTRYIESHKPEFIGQMIRDGMVVRRGLVWTVFDEESAVLLKAVKLMQATGTLHGSTKDADSVMDAFLSGTPSWLISKGALLGYGQNFPFLDEMIFSGFNDSWEMFYQAIRRGHRYGRTERLDVHVPFIPELEGHMWENLGRKKAQWESDIAEQEANYVEALQS